MHVLHEDALSRIAAVAESVVVLDQKMERGFAEVRTDMDHGFAEVRADMDHRFAEVRADMDHRFAEVKADMDHRFADVKTNMDSQSAELRRHMGVLYEQTVESIAITRDSPRRLGDAWIPSRRLFVSTVPPSVATMPKSRR
jgi:hypothetical protein